MQERQSALEREVEEEEKEKREKEEEYEIEYKKKEREYINKIKRQIRAEQEDEKRRRWDQKTGLRLHIAHPKLERTAVAEVWMEDNPKQATLVSIEHEIKKMAIQAEQEQAEAEPHTSKNREDENTERKANEKKTLAVPDIAQTQERTQQSSSSTRKPTTNKMTFTKEDVDRHYNMKREQDKVRSREFRLKHGAHSPFY